RRVRRGPREHRRQRRTAGEVRLRLLPRGVHVLPRAEGRGLLVGGCRLAEREGHRRQPRHQSGADPHRLERRPGGRGQGARDAEELLHQRRHPAGARLREGGRLPVPLRLAELHHRAPRRLRAAGPDQCRMARRDAGRGHLRPRQRPRRALCGGAERHHGERQLRPGARAVADHRRSPPHLPRPHQGAAMSLTADHPLTSDQQDGEATAPRPVLAVDLVTDPALAGGIASLARGLEEAGAGALTLSDGGLHPVHVAAHLAPLTRAIGLLPRTDAIYVEPFHLATQLMSLDHLSHGRAGWLLQAETDPSAAAAVGREVLGLEATAREAADVLAAVRRVWDSWAPDAVVRDVERGVYVDASRLQYADVEAETFSVRGPAITPRSPQGLPPVLVADTDRAAVGAQVAADTADGRVLDLDVSGGARTEQLAAWITEALEEGPTGNGERVRLVRLVGLDLEADPLGTVGQLAAELRARGLLSPTPAPRRT